MLYKISVILLKNKSYVKALLLYKILVNLFKIFIYFCIKWEPTGFSEKHETMQDISENQTFSGYSQLFGSPSGQFGVLFQQRRQCGFVKWDVLCAFEKPPSAFRIQHSCKNPLKNRNVSIFLIENTLDCNVLNKNEKKLEKCFHTA